MQYEDLAGTSREAGYDGSNSGENITDDVQSLCNGEAATGQFGANAAWWAIGVLAFNLNSAVNRLALGNRWVTKRLKAVRFALINLAGRVVCHARKLLIRLVHGHPSFPLLVGAHRRIAR